MNNANAINVLRVAINANNTAIATNKADLQYYNNVSISQSSKIDNNKANIQQNDTDIANNTSSISANSTKIERNKNEIAAVRTLATAAATSILTLSITKEIQKGKKLRKAGDTGSHGKDNILVSVIVSKTGKFLVSFRVIIQPNGMMVSQRNYSTWYDTLNIPAGNHKLKTSLRKERSKVSGTEFVTDGDTYAKNLPHYVFYEDLMSLTKGEKLELKSICDEFGDLYSLLHFNAFDAQISDMDFECPTGDTPS